MVDFSSTCLTAEKINWLGNLNRLTHLNLQHVQHFKANLMKAIALNCPDLQSLNLNNCVDWVDEDLCALKIVCMSCSKLQHLNVGRICCHSDGTKEGNFICKVIAGMKHLRSLSIAPCCLVRVADEKLHSTSDGLLKKNIPRRSSMADGLDKPSGAINRAASTSSTMTTESGYVTRRVTHQKEINERVMQSGSGLDDLVKGLKKIEEVEFIGVGYSSVFSIPDESTGLSYVCPLTRNILDATLLPLKNWAHLRRLTLAGLRGLGSFRSLIEMTKHCNLLEYLSLADIGLPGNSFALSSLPQALTNCKSLKKLRVDQPHYNLTEKVMAALQNCRNIESILISCKSGKIPKDVEPYIRLFDSCKKLCVFQLFSGASMIHCRRLTKELLKRYQKLRPPLSIAILHFSQSLTGHGLQGIPFAHLKTLTCFESKIAQ
ncbi:F-box/LRR-repeat protein 18-like isoform X3 [Rhopilema esculentum]